MTIDATDMLLVHRVFRREFGGFPELIESVSPGDASRAELVAKHIEFMLDALHHHHAAEDALAWPVLMARVPDRRDEIARMAEQHDVISAAIDNARSDIAIWTTTTDGQSTAQLQTSVAELIRHLNDHLDEEERKAVPVIEAHLTEQEWKAAIERGASFLSKHPVLGIVLGGLVLDYSSPQEGRQFLAGVPMPQRLLIRWLGPRMTASYRRRLYGRWPRT